MRFVILGAGAIGGVVGVRLAEAGYEVALLARGQHLAAIQADGLTLETPAGTSTHRIPAASGPAELGLTDEDVVLVCVKGQDTQAALASLREARPNGVPVVMLQNGVENERAALRIFPDVYGAAVLIPAAHLEPGVVQAFSIPLSGKLDVGRYPAGVDARTETIVAALDASSFSSLANPAIMDAKYEKLLENLANAPQAVCGVGAPGLGDLIEHLRREGRAVLDAAGIRHRPEDPRHRAENFHYEGIGEIPGRPRAGGSTWQSLATGRPLESDYLTGEIVLQGRLSGVPTPLNELTLALLYETVASGREPGWISAGEITARAGV